MESLGVVWFLDSFWSVRPRPANMFDVGKEHHTLLFVCTGALCRCTCVWVPDSYPVFLRNHPPCLIEARPRPLVAGSDCFDEVD